MNWKSIEGQWHQLLGQAKSKWAKLTDDDLRNIGGKREPLIGKLEERHGLAEDADRRVNAWIAKLTAPRDKGAARKEEPSKPN